MKIAFAGDAIVQSSIAIEKIAVRLLAMLCAAYEVTVFVSREKESLLIKKISGINCKVENYEGGKVARVLRFLYKKVITSKSGKKKFYDIKILPSHRDVPVLSRRTLIIIHDCLDLNYYGVKLVSLFKKYELLRLMREVTDCVCVSENTLNELNRSLDAKKINKSVIYNAIDIHVPSKRFRVHDNSFILYVGSVYIRRVTTLLEAYKKGIIADQGWPDLLIVGGREDFDINRKIIDLNLHQKVKFIKGASDDFVANAYMDSEMFVYPSSYEGFGIPPMEALAAGKIVVTGNNSSLRELYAGYAYLVDDVWDANQLHKAMEEALLKRGEYDCESAVEYSKKFSWEVMLSNYKTTVEQIFKQLPVDI